MQTVKREEIIKKANAMIAEAETPERRQMLQDVVSSLLIALEEYRGFNYIAWREGGCQKWINDGEPEDTTHYLGDKTQIFFY